MRAARSSPTTGTVSGTGSSACALDVGEGKALPHVMAVGARGHVADAPAVGKYRLVAGRVRIGGLDREQH